ARIFSLIALALFTGGGLPVPALAGQEHGAAEGVYMPQGALVFFIASMGLLIYWLRQRQLVRETGWRYIQYAALFFILWNLDAFTAHLLDEQLGVVDMLAVAPELVWIDAGDFPRALAWFYYAVKLDHLLCVPALLFLYFGLRRLLRDAGVRGAEAGPP
ncbi:MAG: hypothetical protein ACM3KE_10215, partial [Hyphomicrobiales bacterium]